MSQILTWSKKGKPSCQWAKDLSQVRYDLVCRLQQSAFPGIFCTLLLLSLWPTPKEGEVKEPCTFGATQRFNSKFSPKKSSLSFSPSCPGQLPFVKKAGSHSERHGDAVELLSLILRMLFFSRALMWKGKGQMPHTLPSTCRLLCAVV